MKLNGTESGLTVLGKSPEDFSRPGYTIARIKKFSPHKRADVGGQVKAYQDFKNSGAEVDASGIDQMDKDKIKRETVGLSLEASSQIWKKIYHWVGEHPPGIIYPINDAKDSLHPISPEDLSHALESEDSVQVVKVLDRHTVGIIRHQIHSWVNEQEARLLQPEPTQGEERKKYKIYERYKKVLLLGMSNVHDEGTLKPATSPELHIGGGFITARKIIWGVLGILPHVFKRQYGRSPTKNELLNLVRLARPLVFAISMTDVYVLGDIQEILGQIQTVDETQRSSLKMTLDPSKFCILKEGDNLSLEIKSSALDAIDKLLETPRKNREKPTSRTGCPAAAAAGADGKNVVSELYDWFAKLYEEFYINEQE